MTVLTIISAPMQPLYWCFAVIPWTSPALICPFSLLTPVNYATEVPSHLASYRIRTNEGTIWRMESRRKKKLRCFLFTASLLWTMFRLLAFSPQPTHYLQLPLCVLSFIPFLAGSSTRNFFLWSFSSRVILMARLWESQYTLTCPYLPK